MGEFPHIIITDEDIDRVHANANFGSMSKRDVVNEGVLKYAFGYTGGHTQLCILLEHGLIRKPAPGRYDSTLTKKGLRYLQAIYSGRFGELVAIAKSAR